MRQVPESSVQPVSSSALTVGIVTLPRAEGVLEGVRYVYQYVMMMVLTWSDATTGLLITARL